MLKSDVSYNIHNPYNIKNPWKINSLSPSVWASVIFIQHIIKKKYPVSYPPFLKQS